MNIVFGGEMHRVGVGSLAFRQRSGAPFKARRHLPGRYRFFCVVAATAIISAIGPVAHADPITTIYNTGVDRNHVMLPFGANDPNYTMLKGPTGSVPAQSPAQVGNTAGPPDKSAITSLFVPTGQTVSFQTSFSLAGYVPATAVITGRALTDLTQVAINLNGVAVTLVPDTQWSWVSFVINSGFVAGTNVLTFVLLNQGSDEALDVEMTGVAQAVVEPVMLLSLGMAGLWVIFSHQRRYQRQIIAETVARQISPSYGYS